MLLVTAWPLHATLLPSEIPQVHVSEWTPRAGDSFVVDTKENIGYLVHQNGGFTSFRVVTGQRRTVRYIGRTYNAKTPVRKWEVLTMETKGDRRTFGPRGTFLRFFYQGEKTAYGIHAHHQGDEMLADDERFRSMGCIIVSEDVMDLLTETFRLSGDRIAVRTVFGFDEVSVTFDVLKKFVANSGQEL